jgi:hypothetical protein
MALVFPGLLVDTEDDGQLPATSDSIEWEYASGKN